MKKKLFMVFFLCVLSWFLCSGAFAQVRPGTYSISPYVGGYAFDSNQYLKSSAVYGLRLGYDFTRYFGMEAAGNMLWPIGERPVTAEDRCMVGNYHLDAIVNLLPRYRLVPYLAGGFGGQSINYPPAVQNKTAATVNYGGGLKFFLTDYLALRADVRQHYIFDEAKKDFEWTFGVSVLLGGEKPAPPPPPLAAPAGVFASPLSDSQINVSWAAASGAANYKIYRDGKFIATNPAGYLSDKGLTASTRYCYQVASVEASGKESEQSNQACATTLAPSKPIPPAPTELKAVPFSDAQINLIWKPVPDAAGYKIYRDGSYQTTTGAAAAATDTGLQAATRYCYKLIATVADGKESPPSNEACATTMKSKLEEQKMDAAAAAVAKEMFEKGRARINIEFDFDKDTIKRKYRQELKKFADVMKAHPNLKVVIEGHTDNVGNRNYNVRLSTSRARAVKSYLIKHFGIEEARLKAKGYGMTKPIASNKTAAGRQQNRRVEAVVEYFNR